MVKVVTQIPNGSSLPMYENPGPMSFPDGKHARQAKAYRLRAEEIRTIAEITWDEGCRDALSRIAGEYERLARVMDGMRPTGNRDEDNTSLGLSEVDGTG